MVPGLSNVTRAQAAAGAGITTVTAGVTGGLEKAAAMAGDTLRSIFGGLPWEMSPDAIVDAVAGNAGEAAGILIGGVL